MTVSFGVRPRCRGVCMCHMCVGTGGSDDQRRCQLTGSDVKKLAVRVKKSTGATEDALGGKGAIAHQRSSFCLAHFPLSAVQVRALAPRSKPLQRCGIPLPLQTRPPSVRVSDHASAGHRLHQAQRCQWWRRRQPLAPPRRSNPAQDPAGSHHERDDVKKNCFLGMLRCKSGSLEGQ